MGFGADVLAIIVGSVTTMLLSATMVVASLKAGITPGVSIAICHTCKRPHRSPSPPLSCR